MGRPTKHTPEKGDARSRLLEAARDLIRTKGFAATSVDDLCRAAGVTKGAFFHHFESKDALGVAAANFWAATTSAFFATAPYHAPSDPLDRVLAYIAFRKAIISDELTEFTCLVGTLAQEVHQSSPAIRDACGQTILSHAATLEDDIEAVLQARGMAKEVTPHSLALHIQAAIQGAFVIAKATNNPERARDTLDHLDRYIRLLFGSEAKA